LAILVITNRALIDISNGYDLRVYRLCRALSVHEKLVLLAVQISQVHDPVYATLDTGETFSEKFVSVCTDNLKPLFWRHCRLSEVSYFSWGYPSFQRTVTEQIDQMCDEFNIEKIIVFGSNLVGLTRQFGKTKRILLDVCDSVALTIEREISIDHKHILTLTGLKERLSLSRWRRLEGKTPHWFDHVVTINQRDTETIARLSDGCTNLSTIPNGVDPMFEHMYQEGPCKRKGVVFWGNLLFGPNLAAVSYFYSQVYLPYLKPAAIEWCVIGRDPPAFLVDAATHDKNMRLLGFVKNLRDIVVEYPIMVNPMLSGSGLKNKVLEANAMGLAVVSTSLGMESIDGAVAGETFLLAESPDQFFKAVLALLNDEERRVDILRAARQVLLNKYTWNTVDAHWVKLVNRIFLTADK
jgi:glycosyltransferase involved in cell wall biosynthesis